MRLGKEVKCGVPEDDTTLSSPPVGRARRPASTWPRLPACACDGPLPSRSTHSHAHRLQQQCTARLQLHRNTISVKPRPPTRLCACKPRYTHPLSLPALCLTLCLKCLRHSD